MATAAEKEARQAARDVARSAIGVGQARLQAEQPRAAGAFPVRRLRSAGDLSRYAIGGFADDPLAPIPTTAPKAKTKQAAKPRKKLAAPKPVTATTGHAHPQGQFRVGGLRRQPRIPSGGGYQAGAAGAKLLAKLQARGSQAQRGRRGSCRAI